MQIFISYAKEDVETADRLFQSLIRISEIHPWLDHENLLPGMDWEAEILNAIEESQHVILLLSTNSVQKDGFVQKEIRKALDRFSRYPPGKIFIIPIRMEPCELSHSELKKLQYVDMFPDWNKGLQKIVDAIKAKEEKLPEKRESLKNVQDLQHLEARYVFEVGDRIYIRDTSYNIYGDHSYDGKHGVVTYRLYPYGPPYEAVYSIVFDDGTRTPVVWESDMSHEKTVDPRNGIEKNMGKND